MKYTTPILAFAFSTRGEVVWTVRWSAERRRLKINRDTPGG
ncbi:hypothetical protein C7433_10426 [Pantoea sp. PNA 03-3]|nr:hypothetical protein C7433_10426 [Pantoea sp. PNA 03-3]